MRSIEREHVRGAAMLALWLALVGCGGGNASNAAPPPPPSASKTLSITASGVGTVTSTPEGLSCVATTCSGTFDQGTSVTLNALPGPNYALESWSGACKGSTPNCALTLDADASVTVSFAPVVPQPGVPYVNFVDTPSAPTSGGENNAGGYLSLFGSNFGSPTGLGSATKVFIGGVEVANYRYLGPAKVAGKIGLQQLTVQVGGLGGAAAGTSLPIKVVVGGVASNVDQTFTPTRGRVLFVAQDGSDATAAPGDIARPFRHLQDNAVYKGAYFASDAGDQIVIRGGTWSDTTGVDGTWMRFSMNKYARNGTPTAWIHVTAYPGPINGNAIENVHYVTPPGAAGGIWGPWSAIAGTSGEYVAVSNLSFEVSGGATRDAAPINFQYTGGHWRVVNNEIGPWVAGNSPTLNAAGISGHGDGMVVLGNHIHDIQGTAELQNHGIYADTTAQNWDVGFNWIHDVSGGSLIQFNDNEGGAGTYALPHGGTWPGFVGIQVHSNWLENAAKYGINFSDQGSTKTGTYDGRIWNNVIIGTQLPPLRILSTQPRQSLWFAFNTLYDCMTTNSGSGNGFVRAEGWSDMPGVNNVFYDNIFAIGPATTAGTAWFADDGGTPASTKTYDFKRNLYFAGRQSPAAPARIGDSVAVIGDPLFTDAAGGDFSTQAASPARKAATQALPKGFDAVTDFTGKVWRASGASDIGAFSAP